MTPSNKTILFVFALSAALEADRKPIFGKPKKNTNQQFFSLLNSQTKRVALESGVDVVWMDETQQQGDTFGERYANAFQYLFRQGYENVISIGNDTPDLNASHILKAVEALSQQDLVFGPSKDGGVYLLGYSKNAFNRKSFEHFSWLSPTLSTEIVKFSKQNKLVFSILETLADIDHKRDALHFAYISSASVIASFILFHTRIVQENNTHYNLFFYTNLHQHSFLLRGPPSV